MASKRISQLAKELGVDSKAIVAKCHAEGIPDTLVKGHMSTVSAGLEATIREWFSGGGTATAVETAQKVEIPKPKTVRPSRAKKAEDGSDVPETKAPEPGEAPAPAPAAPAQPSVMAPPPVEAAPPQPAPAAPKLAPTKIAPAPSAPTHAESKPETPPAALKPAASAPAAPPAERKPPSGGPGAQPGHHHRPGGPAGVHPPVAPANVPRKPTVVSPAGPKLEVRSPVKLAGPKIVRIEAPEQVEAPRPRRVGPPTTGGAGAGVRRGPGGPGGAVEDDDHGRSPRRKTAGGGGGGGQGAGAGGPSKRSSGTGIPDRRRASSGPEWVGGVFSEQDLIEREARLARAGGFVKKQRQALKGREGQAIGPQKAEGKVRIAAPFTIKDVSEATGVKASEIVKKLFIQGIMRKINDPIEVEKAIELLMEFDIELEVVEAKTAEEEVSAQFEDRAAIDTRPRGPVVTILGHVDHGKTSLLDKIRNANVAAGEAGGITQRTSAFKVPLELAGEKKEVVFLDTPGHEAFTSMRSRGANMTDVVVLVVSAPEGVMPQTIESINHAKAAEVPLVVALNKIDRPDATEAQIQKTLRQLADAGLQPQEWGGDTEIVRTSATTGQGIPQLLEVLDLQSQILELKADFGGPGRGTVIEAKQEEGRGPVASLLVQEGVLKVGDFIAVGRSFGKIRDITDDRGNKLKEAYPPSPVQVSGLDEVPDAGDRFYIVDSLKQAQEAAEHRRHREREAELAQPKLTLDTLFTQMTDKEVKEIRVVVKAAEQGTVDVLSKECEKVGTAEVKVRVLHGAVGGINESDVLLADASRAIIIGFNVIASGKARQLAESKGIEIRTYQVIYDITDDLKMAAEGLLAPELREEVLGHAEVRQVFKVTKVGSIAGCYVTDGVIERNALIRVTRQNVVIEHDRVLEQLKRFKDDAKDVRAGMECGMKIVGYDDIKEGDVLECYKKVEFKRNLDGTVKASAKAEKPAKPEKAGKR